MRNLAFNDFSGGMVTDPRDTRINVCRICSQFDAFTYPNKLVPNPSSVNGDTNAATDYLQNFCYDAGTMFALGGVGFWGGPAMILRQSSYEGNTNVWTTPSNNEGNADIDSQEALVFIPYHGYIYGLAAGVNVWSFEENGGAFNNSAQSLSHTNAAPAIVHSKDDILYIPTDNQLTTYNFGTSTWTVGALVLPAAFVITHICEYGNYLAIAAFNTSTGTSKVFIWDRNSSLTTLSETVDWGFGKLMLIQEMRGILVGVSIIDTTMGAPVTAGRLIFKSYNSGSSIGSDNGIYPGAVKFNELVSSTTGNTLYQCKQFGDERTYFMASFTLEGVLYEGVWAIGYSNTGELSVVHDRKPNNDTQTSGGVMLNFINVGDSMMMAFIDATVTKVTMTDMQPNYNTTAIYETTINPLQPERYRLTSGMRTEKKQVISSRLCTEVLTSSENAVLEYRVDGGSWQPLINATADGLPVRETGNTDLNGNATVQGREFEFHLASSHGAELTEFVYKLDENSTLFDPA